MNSEKLGKKVGAGVSAVLLLAGAGNAQAEDLGTKFEITPYLWAVGLDTDITVGNRTVNIDRSASDIFDGVDIGANFLTVAQFNRFIVFGQADFLSFNSDELDDAPARGSLDVDMTLGTLGLGYQFDGWKEGQTFDVLVGARYLELENELKLDGIGKVKNKRDVTDPIVMLRPSLRLSERWRFNPTISVGGGGDSELTYELQPQFQFKITDNVALRFGYRRLFYEIESNDGTRSFDGTFEGAILGIGGTFGAPIRMSKAEPAPAPVMAAASPPPLPVAPPAPPPDGDRDGIADSDDVCPNTISGATIDNVGCALDLSLAAYFDYDSAVLKPTSYPDLDRAVQLLQRLPTMQGAVEGYTDSIGNDSYNKTLSERRAQAVADYLISQGISQTRLKAEGRGEEQPVADNATPEGRAENRRVILRRR